MVRRPRNSTPKRREAAKKARRPAARPKRPDPARITRIADELAALYPGATVELDFADPYQLLVATILAAQSSDKTVNGVTPALFAKFPDARALAAADPSELETLIKKTGFFRMKAKHLLGTARALVERHDGRVPDTMEGLCALPGVARKTANVVLGCAFGKNEGVVVDLHVIRLAGRLKLSAHDKQDKIEQDLMAIVPRERWNKFAHGLIWHGRRVCKPQPDCDRCTLAPACPSAFAFPKFKKPATKGKK
jgi:endonuclease-3